MFQRIYEIGLAGRNVEISQESWDQVREYARSHKFFLVEHLNNLYKYVGAQTFYERPTRFNFELATAKDEKIEIIHVR